MAEFKLFTEPKYVDWDWYKDREVADHINQPGHRERLLEAVELIGGILVVQERPFSVADWGAGNGGLLMTLKERFPAIKAWGYDMCPANVNYARECYGVDVSLVDIVHERLDLQELGDVIVLTEVLEHLIDPQSLLARVPRSGTRRLIVASSPAAETPDRHYEYHNWAWTNESYAKMFERTGWTVLRHYVTAINGTQFIVASRG